MVLRLQKQGGETEEKEGPERWLVPWGGGERLGGHNLLEARTPLVPLVISPGGTESWAWGSVCSFDLQGELLGQQKQNWANHTRRSGDKT